MRIAGERLAKYRKDNPIKIKPENRGKFSASAKRADMTTAQFADHVLSHKDDYSATQVKRANFAKNARSWNKG